MRTNSKKKISMTIIGFGNHLEGNRPVNQVKVKVFNVQSLKRSLTGSLDIFLAVVGVPDLFFIFIFFRTLFLEPRYISFCFTLDVMKI
jgi:hypothetical protein